MNLRHNLMQIWVSSRHITYERLSKSWIDSIVHTNILRNTIFTVYFLNNNLLTSFYRAQIFHLFKSSQCFDVFQLEVLNTSECYPCQHCQIYIKTPTYNTCNTPAFKFPFYHVQLCDVTIPLLCH